MQVQNKYVRVQIGNKIREKHNYIKDSYLKLFSKGQISNDYTNYSYNLSKDLSHNLILTLDTLQADGTNEIVTINKGVSNMTGTPQSITTSYKFSNETYFYLNNEQQTDRTILDGKRIISISFNNYTFLDTTEMDLQFNGNEVLTISREDIITTDAICSGYEYPYHLAPILKKYSDISSGYPINYEICAYIYSVGLGQQIGKMEEEYIVGKDVEIKEEDDTTFSFILKKSIDVGIYPGNSEYPSLTKYPTTFKIKVSRYPSVVTYAEDNLFPSNADYKYIIMKYKMYYINRGSRVVETGEEYTMSFYTNKEGILTIKDKIERNDNNE